MLASCWHCYLQASADFLSLQCCELGSFGRCSELREREARLLDHSQFQTKNKKDLTISFLSLKYFSCIPFVLSVNMAVALLLRSPSLKCTLNNCLFLNRHIILFFCAEVASFYQAKESSGF